MAAARLSGRGAACYRSPVCESEPILHGHDIAPFVWSFFREKSEQVFARSSNAAPWAWLVPAAACWGPGAVLSMAALAYVPPLTPLVTQLIASLAVLRPVLGWQRSVQPCNRQLLALGRLGRLNLGASCTLGHLASAIQKMRRHNRAATGAVEDKAGRDRYLEWITRPSLKSARRTTLAKSEN